MAPVRMNDGRKGGRQAGRQSVDRDDTKRGWMLWMGLKYLPFDHHQTGGRWMWLWWWVVDWLEWMEGCEGD